jgi:hypothetical protein
MTIVDYRSAAEAEAKAALALMPTGWDYKTWENIGWHWHLYKGRLRVCKDHGGMWSAWIIDVTGGGPRTTSVKHDDPVSAALYEINAFEDHRKTVTARLQTINQELTSIKAALKRRKAKKA